MKTHNAGAEVQTTPRDFFLWFGAMAAFYGAVISFVTLLFEYIDYLFPDPLAYGGDLYAGSVRFAMASLIVLAPIALGLIYFIRRSTLEDHKRQFVSVRRWAILLTLFIAGATIVIDLITLINTFLGGELTSRFLLQVAVILLVAGGVFLYFLAELRGYWFRHPRRALAVSAAAALAALAAVVSGFFIIGTPEDMRMMRYDQQKVQDLQTLQYEITNYYQMKRELPESLAELSDPLAGAYIPRDPQGDGYRYEKESELSFTLCATFNRPSPDFAGRGDYPKREVSMPRPGYAEDTWEHQAGETCFTRTIDPERYPPFQRTLEAR